MEAWKFVEVDRDKGGFLNHMGFCKSKCFAEFEVDFLQALLMNDFVALGSFCHLAAVFVGSSAPVNARVQGPDHLSPCVFSEKHLLGWQLLLGSFEQEQALCAEQCATHPRACAYTWVVQNRSRVGKKQLYCSVLKD